METKYKIASTRDLDDLSDQHVPKKKVFVGWRFGVISGSVSVSIVLVLNLSFTLWTLSQKEIENQLGTLHEGRCDTVRSLNTAAHLVINIFSTIILASSNYCMQCLSAPTRAEIDKQHAQGMWLDIGILSMRNLRHISRKRALLWIALGISSLPLHLFYNSAIFASISANNYTAFTVNSAFMDATSLDGFNITGASPEYVAVVLQQAARNGSLERMDNSPCIQAYAHDYLSDRSNLLLVTSHGNSSSTPALFATVTSHKNDYNGNCAPDLYHWICPNADCSDPCQYHLPEVLADASHWKPYSEAEGVEVEVEYCLSQRTTEHCKLQFSVQIIIMIIFINTLKMILMLYVVFGLNETPLMTIGDAIASFLHEEDPTTKGSCLVSKYDIKINKIQWQYREGESDALPAIAWLPIKVRWAHAVSRTRLWACGVMISSAVTVCAVLLIWGISAIKGPKDIGTLWKLGLGAVSARTLINWAGLGGPSTLVTNVLLANIAQPVLSFIYFSYNGIFTCMLAEREWNQFARKAKSLRVSGIPSGFQRSTYFLQLPYRFAIPIMLLSGVLHWLVSQSIFLVAIETYSQDKQYKQSYDITQNSDIEPEQLTCGYSPIAIMFVIILTVVMMLFGVGVGLQRYESGMPVAGSCSVVLSAACHVEDDNTAGSKMALKPVQWGVIRSGGEHDVGHCGFSDTEVTFPQEFAMYAGKL